MIIKNNRCAVVENTNQDIYNGSFTNESEDITYVYIISFEPGTQARGHKVADFKLFQKIENGQLIFIDYSTGIYTGILKELLRGF